jgi:spore germination cell wall hydrolase CwlJ-like protein
MNFSADDLDNLCLCAWREARGEGEDGLRAVMHVIVNRAKAWYHARQDPLHDTIYAKNQFTSMSVSSDPEYSLMPLVGDPQYAYCLGIAPDVLAETDPDLTNGARYYANLKYVTSGWFITSIVNCPETHPQTAVVGQQTFYL